MEVGSKVILVNDNWAIARILHPLCGKVKMPIKNEIYTIRSVEKDCIGVLTILLEEIVNPNIPYFNPMTDKVTSQEVTFRLDRFRQLTIEELVKMELLSVEI